MSVGILVITHGKIGEHIVQTACDTLGACPLPIECLSIPNNSGNLDKIRDQAQERFERVNQGEGVLIMTDLYGSTPSNIAAELLTDQHAILISGLNLPMLIRSLNYSDLPLETLAQKAVSAAKEGAFITQSTEQ